MILGIINRIFNRTPWFFLFLALLVIWCFFGKTAVEYSMISADPNIAYVERETKALSSIDPGAGAQLATIARNRDICALAATLHMYDSQTGGNGIRAVANDLARFNGDLPWFGLNAVGVNATAFATADERNAFAQCHGFTYRTLLTADESGTAAAQYAAALLNAERKGGDVWRVIQDEPAALSIHPYLEGHDAAWEFFCQERGWLTPILTTLSPSEGDNETNGPPPVLEMVEVARRFHPLVRDVYREKETGEDNGNFNPYFGRLIVEMFTCYGDLFGACRELDLPIAEVVDVVYANQDDFDFSENPLRRQEQIKTAASRLGYLFRNKPTVWEAVKNQINTLWLEEQAPDQAERLMKSYPAGDLPTFLRAYYEDMAPNAAQALIVYGDLGLYILNQYKDHDRFREFLNNRKVGIRIIPFTLRHPKDGFAMLADGDFRWVDKYFNADGTERDQGWIKDIPLVGGPLNVIDNWRQGMPNTWGEIGWAAFDIADTALLIATFSASKGVTESAKQAGKVTAKKTVESAAKRAIAKAIGSASKTLGGSVLGRVGLRTVSLLTRTAKLIMIPIRLGSHVVYSTGKAVWMGAKSVYQAWRTLPSFVRRAICGVLGFAGLVYAFDARNTADAIRRMIAGFGTAMGETAQKAAQGTAEAFANALSKTLAGIIPENPSRFWIWSGWVLGIGVFTLGAFFTRINRDEWHRFIKGT